MQVVENRTSLVATILERNRDPSLPEYDRLRVRVDGAVPVPGKADLLSTSRGTEILLIVRRALLTDVARPGASIHCQARRTPDGAMCDPYPEPGTFALAPPSP